jgi:microsomal dipeptidase-like Zn-dependent dipeptidase
MSIAARDSEMRKEPLPFAVTAAGPVLSDVSRRRRTLGESDVLRKRYVDSWRAGGIRVVTLEADSIQSAEDLLAEVNQHDSNLQLLSPELALPADDPIGVILAPSTLALDGPDSVWLWKQLGAAVCCLSYNLRNPYCDGVGEPRDGGLSHAGKSLVRQLCDASILIDLSHLSDNSVSDIFSLVDGPLIASHSGSRTICSTPRNITDDQALEVARRGGIVGVSVHPTLLAPTGATMQTFADHIFHFIDLLGIDHVAIGADFIGSSLDIATPVLKKSDPANAIYDLNELMADGLENFHKLGDLASVLQKRGLDSTSLAKVAHDNYLGVLQKVVTG